MPQFCYIFTIHSKAAFSSEAQLFALWTPTAIRCPAADSFVPNMINEELTLPPNVLVAKSSYVARFNASILLDPVSCNLAIWILYRKQIAIPRMPLCGNLGKARL